MIYTVLALAAPIAGASAMAGLWHTPTDSMRGLWRTVAVATSLICTVAMAIIALPIDAFTLGAPPSQVTIVLFAVGLWCGLAALLSDEYRTFGNAKRAHPRTFSSEIAHVISTSTMLDDLLMKSAAAFRKDANADAAHVYKVSRRRHRAIRTGTVVANSDSMTSNSAEYGSYLTELAWWAAQESSIVRTEDIYEIPVLSIPISEGHDSYAVIIINNPSSRIRESKIEEWTAAAAMLGCVVADWSARAAYERPGQIAVRLPEARSMLAHCHQLEGAFPALNMALQGIVEYDYLSISWLGKSRSHEDRVSMITNSARIVESRRGWPISGDTTHRVITTGRAVITPDLEMADELSEAQSWERRIGMRSRLIAPIIHNDNVIGTITLAHRLFAHYDADDTQIVNIVAMSVGARLAEILAEREINRLRDTQSFTAALDGRIHTYADDAALLRAAMSHLSVSGIRLYRMDGMHTELRETASAMRRGVPVDQESTRGLEPRHIALNKLPWHRWALDSQRALQINQGDPESLMSESEASVAMSPGVKTGCLVPIKRHGEALGILDVYEERHPDRTMIDITDLAFLEKLADAITASWTKTGVATRAALESPKAIVTEYLKAWSRSVVNPLTSIIGSAELVRRKQPDISPDAAKYLTTIEKSAMRIHEELMATIEDVSIAMGQPEALMPRDRWTWTRPAEHTMDAETSFRRPISVSDSPATPELSATKPEALVTAR